MDQVYYSNTKGQILALNHHNMNLFRARTCYKMLEGSEKWSYPEKLQKRPTRRIKLGGAGNDGMQALEIEEHRLESQSSLGGRSGRGVRRQGTVNLIKKMMRHRVNIINENIEINEYSGSDDDSEGARLRRALKKKMAKDSTYGGRRQVKKDGSVDGGDDDLERGNGSDGEGSDDWNNFRTGGVIQLEKNDGTVAKSTGKVIPNRKNFGRKN